MKTAIAVVLLALASSQADTITNITALERVVVANQVSNVRNEAFFNRTNRMHHTGANGFLIRPFTSVTNRVTLRTLTFNWAGKTRVISEEIKP